MGRMMPLCSLPRSNPGNRHQYKRVNGPYKLIMIAGGDNKLPFGNLPRLREVVPAAREGPERERVAWQRAEERTQWGRLQRWRGKELGELERRSKRSWSELYGRQERQREQLAKDCHGVLGRFRAWRELGGKLREIGGTIRGRTGSVGALSGGVGASATLGAGFVGESAFGSGAGDRKQGGRSLPQLDGRGRGTGA